MDVPWSLGRNHRYRDLRYHPPYRVCYFQSGKDYPFPFDTKAHQSSETIPILGAS